jgi:hypothetical protein
MIQKEQLSELSKWAGFVAIMTIIFGALSAISGVWFYLIGAAPGVIMIILGVKLRGAKNSADALIASGEENPAEINALIASLATYFKIQGILTIVILALGVVGMIFGMFAGLAFYHMFS